MSAVVTGAGLRPDRSGKAFGNQDLSRCSSRDYRPVAAHGCDLNGGLRQHPSVYPDVDAKSTRCAHSAGILRSKTLQTRKETRIARITQMEYMVLEYTYPCDPWWFTCRRPHPRW